MFAGKNNFNFQHLQYLLFGEQFVEQRTTATYYTPYKFSGKEKDSETGYSYFGARYYDSDLSVFISVDRFASKYPNLSSYQYCAWNPIMMIDQNGDSLTLSNLFKNSAKEYEGFLNIMQTEEGRAYFGRYAAAGQTIGGYTYTQDGEYHKQGVDMLLDIKEQSNPDYVGDCDQPKVVGNRLKITSTIIPFSYSFWRSRILFNEFNGSKNPSKDIEGKIYGFVMLWISFTICHEVMLHAEFWVKDWLDDGILTDQDKISHHEDGYNQMKEPKWYSNGKVWPNIPFKVLQEINRNKNYNTKDEKIWKILQEAL